MKKARFARSFDAVAVAYERGRPSYPREAVDALVTGLALGPEATVVDLAAGTGKLTRELTPRFVRVIAVEPLAAMLEQLRLAAPEADAVSGKADDMPIGDAVADAVFVAQAFHWFADREALAEITRVLRPGGGLGLIWNISPWETREGIWWAALDDLLDSGPADLSVARGHSSGEWREALDADGRFGPLEHAEFPHVQRLSGLDFRASLESRSYMAMLDAESRAAVFAEVEKLLERDDSPLRDGAMSVPMTAHVFWARMGGD